jgi:hypothetical protein
LLLKDVIVGNTSSSSSWELLIPPLGFSNDTRSDVMLLGNWAHHKVSSRLQFVTEGSHTPPMPLPEHGGDDHDSEETLPLVRAIILAKGTLFQDM